jgi:hypothetical protein
MESGQTTHSDCIKQSTHTKKQETGKTIKIIKNTNNRTENGYEQPKKSKKNDKQL